MNSPNSNKGCASVAAHGLTDLCSNQTVYKGTNWLTCKGHTDGLTDFHRKHIVYVGARLTDWLTQKAQCGCGGAYWLADLHRQHNVYEGHIDWLTDLHRQHYVDVRHTDWLTDLHRQHNVYVGHTDWLTYTESSVYVRVHKLTYLHTKHNVYVGHTDWLTNLQRKHNVYAGHTDWLTDSHRQHNVNVKGFASWITYQKAQWVCGAHWLTYTESTMWM